MGFPAADDDPTPIRDVVAIDGPSGAGKSTVARRLAAALGFAYLDTGAMYRAVTWHLLAHGGVEPLEERRVAELLDDLDLRLDAGGAVRIGDEDVTPHLRSHEVESRVSAVSALPVVRERMRGLQRQVARRGPVVAEGRDMGSVVFPRARWKIYLDAEAAERARRRHLDFVRAGRDVTPQQVLEEIEVRDRLDSTRSDAPLIRTEDAILYDSTDRTLEQVVDDLAAAVRRGAGGAADAP